MEIFKDFQEICVDRLTVTDGPALEMTANITSPKQMELVMMGNVYGPAGLRSRYFSQQRDSMLRLSCSYNGRTRSDIVEIGKSVRLPTYGNFGGGSP